MTCSSFCFSVEQLAGHPCLPAWGGSSGQQVLGGTCDGCGVDLSLGMEVHGSGASRHLLCPACHAACHLREISATKNGRLFYSESMTQGDASLISLGMAVLLESTEDRRRSRAGLAIAEVAKKIRVSCEGFQKHFDSLFVSSHPKTKPSENYGRSAFSLSVTDPVVFLDALRKTKNKADADGDIFEIDSLPILVFVNPGALRRFAKNESIQNDFWGNPAIVDIFSNPITGEQVETGELA